jgi:DNA-binding Xre family transcriptional regulator
MIFVSFWISLLSFETNIRIAISSDFFDLTTIYVMLNKKRGVILTVYKAKKSNLKALLSKNNTKLGALAATTGISEPLLNEYLSTKVMSLNNAMTISKELECSVEDLYVWNVTKE